MRWSLSKSSPVQRHAVISEDHDPLFDDDTPTANGQIEYRREPEGRGWSI